jgi:hypothetical protein
MAGRGPAPKPASQRRRRNEPARGEWTDLPSLDKPVLARAPKEWPAEAKMLWEAWRQDPVTATYSPADVLALKQLCLRFGDLADTEQRLRMDGLGLTPKGKRDLRLRMAPEALTGAELSKPAEVRRLRIVAPEVAQSA